MGEEKGEMLQTPSEMVVNAVATKTEKNPTELPPLYETINPDALDQLFPEGAGDGVITFTYNRHQIVVSEAGEVMVQSNEPDSFGQER